MKRKNTIAIVFLCLLFSTVFAQQKNVRTQAKIMVKAGVINHTVALRWAVNQPIAWQKANQLRFTLKRFTILKDGKILPKPTTITLGSFKPAPLEQWKTSIEKNNYAAIAAQALFGKDFEVKMGASQNKIDYIVNKSKEIEQRFAYALMAADLDFDVAKLAGWGYVDTTAKPNEKYLYRVILNNSTNPNVTINDGNVAVAIYEAEKLPIPQDFVGLFKDKNVVLSWDYRLLKRFYTSFYIEKSENGKDFTQISDLPIVDMNSKERKPTTSMLHVDSLGQNGKNYYYRIRGKTVFNEFGPYSKVIKGKGQKKLNVGAQITFSDIAKDETILLKWTVNENNSKDIRHFALLHSETDKEDSYKVVQDFIPATQRKLITKSIAGSNYFKIRTVGKETGFTDSFAVLLQPNDETPPTIPTSVTGKIDSTGVATISWKKNTEKDLMGYHVFRATNKGEEFVRITNMAITQPFYKDSIQLQNLNTKVYYHIAAIDNRHNQSKFSKVLTLKKPDVIIPQAPVFTNYTQKDGIITLNFKRSFSKDVVKHQLYRIKTSEIAKGNWQLIFETSKIQPLYTYADKELMSNEQYRYYLKAIDDNGLVSHPSQNITLTAIDTRPIQAIKNFRVKKKKESFVLSWQLTTQEITEILVYKSINDQKPTLWKTLSGNTTTLTDKTIKKENRYTYLLKAMLVNQKPTATKKISIRY